MSQLSVIVKYPLGFVVSYVQPVTQHYESKSTSVIKVATLKNADDFHYGGKPSHAATNQHLSLSARMNDTKEDTGKSMKNVLQYA